MKPLRGSLAEIGRNHQAMSRQMDGWKKAVREERERETEEG